MLSFKQFLEGKMKDIATNAEEDKLLGINKNINVNTSRHPNIIKQATSISKQFNIPIEDVYKELDYQRTQQEHWSNIWAAVKRKFNK